MMRRFAACAVASALLWTTSIGAADPTPYTPPEFPAAPDPGPMVLRLFGMTLFVLLMCAVVLWCVRWAKRPRIAAVPSDKLRSIESLSLASRSSIHLVQAGSARVLVAIDAAGVKAVQLADDNFAAVMAGMGVPEPADSGPSVAEMMSVLAASRRAA
jgi:flagellar biogenesis protein FliO